MFPGPEACPSDCSPAAWELFSAAANGQIDDVRRILRNSPELMHSFIWYETPLHYAVRENHIEVVRELLTAGINPAYSNFTYSAWQSLLPIARERDDNEMHELLFGEMQRRFQFDPAYQPLWDVIAAGDIAAARGLIEANSQLVHIGDEHGNRAVHWAVLARRIPILQLLLAAGADINAKRADMQTPLHLALDRDYWFGKSHQPDPDTTSEDVVKFLLENGAEYEFSAAVALNDVDVVKAELSRDPDRARRLDDSRRSPLSIAAVRGHMELVQMFLSLGADPNLPEHCAPGGRALFEASARNDLEMMTLLLEHGADADAYVDSCGNCLSIAQQGDGRVADAVELLLQHGALPGEWEIDTQEKVAAALEDAAFIPNRDLWSSVLGRILSEDSVALLDQYIVRFGEDDIQRLNPSNGWRLPRSQRMLRKLLEHGLNINARDWYGRTFLHYAAVDPAPANAKFLVEAGIDTDIVDHLSGTTALGLAAKHGSLEVVEVLLSAGADIGLPTARRWAQPLTLAEAHGHQTIVDRLRN